MINYQVKGRKSMLGVIGFSLAAVVIAAFAWSSQEVYRTVGLLRLRAFCTAFGLLAVAMVFWAIIVAAKDVDVTHNLMLAADCLLLLGTACMAIVLVGEISVLALSMLGGIVALLITWRAFIQPPTAYVHGGLLYFNLQGSSRLFIVGLFAFVWLPAMMLVGNKVANDVLVARRRYSLQMYFVLLVALMAIFAKARRAGAIIGLFALIILVFGLATVFNFALKKAHETQGIKRSKGHATRPTTAQ